METLGRVWGAAPVHIALGVNADEALYLGLLFNLLQGLVWFRV